MNFLKEYHGLFHSWTDTLRIVLLAVLAVVLFAPDITMLHIVQYVLGIQVTLSLISHVTRKMLFPYVSLEQFFAKAKEESLSAAIAIFAVCTVLCTLILVSSHLFGGSPQ